MPNKSEIEKSTQLAQDNGALADSELDAVTGGATVPVKKKPQGNGTGEETQNPGLKNQGTVLR